MVLGHCAFAVAAWPRLPVSSSRSRLQSTSPSSGLWQKLERREESEKKWLETLNMVCREILRIKTLAGTWRENGKSALHQNLLTWNRCYHILDQWATTVKLIWKYNKKSFHNVQKKEKIGLQFIGTETSWGLDSWQHHKLNPWHGVYWLRGRIVHVHMHWTVNDYKNNMWHLFYLWVFTSVPSLRANCCGYKMKKSIK